MFAKRQIKKSFTSSRKCLSLRGVTARQEPEVQRTFRAFEAQLPMVLFHLDLFRWFRFHRRKQIASGNVYEATPLPSAMLRQSLYVQPSFATLILSQDYKSRHVVAKLIIIFYSMIERERILKNPTDIIHWIFSQHDNHASPTALSSS